jgi:Plasmid replication region DNA-binding N-term
MIEATAPAGRYGTSARGVRQSDVSHAADALLRTGDRPSVEKIRAKLGGGSPNTINPLLDAWWKTLGVRLDSGPAALHRIPESVAHIAEALWIQALEESRRRLLLEQRASDRVAELDKERLELRSHVLTLREGEMESRVQDRDRVITELKAQVKDLTSMLQKEQASLESVSRQLSAIQTERFVALQASAPTAGHPEKSKRRKSIGNALRPLKRTKARKSRKTPRKRKKSRR